MCARVLSWDFFFFLFLLSGQDLFAALLIGIDLLLLSRFIDR